MLERLKISKFSHPRSPSGKNPLSQSCKWPDWLTQPEVAIVIDAIWNLCLKTSFNTMHVNKLKLYPHQLNHHSQKPFDRFNKFLFPSSFTWNQVNPLLYAILSRNFRKGMSELLICSFKPNKAKALNKRTVTHVSKINSILLTHTNGNADKIHQLTENVIEYDSTCHDFEQIE